MIFNFVRDISYFQSLFETNGYVTANDFDTEFNNFVNYLNKRVVTSINNIKINVYNGILDNKNYVLKNIGNGKIVFEKLNNSHFKNKSISIDKLKYTNPNSLFFIDSFSNYKLFSYLDNLENLLNFADTNFIYDNKLRGKNFYNKSILSNNIDYGAIFEYHLTTESKNFLISNGLIKPNNIIDNTITNIKFANSSITYNKLDFDIQNTRNSTNLVFENNSITTSKIKDNSLDFRTLSEARIGRGLLDKNVIPLNSVLIEKPTITFPETINTYQLCVYSIKKATEIRTIQITGPVETYLNPEFVKRKEELKNLSDKAHSLKKIVEVCYLKMPFDSVIIPTQPSHIALVNEFKTKSSELKALKDLLTNKNRELYTIPQYLPRPRTTTTQQKEFEIPNTKSYKLIDNQNVIKSYHLKDNSFNINNIPDRSVMTNIPNNKFITKNLLSPEVRTKLGI